MTLSSPLVPFLSLQVYWDLEQADAAVSIWYAFDEMNRRNGPIWVEGGSHRGGKPEKRPREPDGAPQRWQRVDRASQTRSLKIITGSRIILVGQWGACRFFSFRCCRCCRRCCRCRCHSPPPSPFPSSSPSPSLPNSPVLRVPQHRHPLCLQGLQFKVSVDLVSHLQMTLQRPSSNCSLDR